jgi:diacylglycerol kinase (ATP)
MNPKSNSTLWASFGHAFRGLFYALRTQRNFRIHFAAVLVVVTLGLWFGVSPQSWALLALTIGGVVALEMLNTALEVFVDLVKPDYHPLAKRIKDLMAGAVLVSAIAAIIVAMLIFGPPILEVLSLR